MTEGTQQTTKEPNTVKITNPHHRNHRQNQILIKLF